MTTLPQDATHNIMWNVGLNNANIERDVVPGRHEVLEGGVVLGLDVSGKGEGQVLLGQLEHQLALPGLLPRRGQPRHLVARQAAHVVVDL